MLLRLILINIKGEKMVNKSEFKKSEIHYTLTPGETVKQLRGLQGLSQNELAEITGISQSNISALENGSRSIGRQRAMTLAKALRVHPAVILFPDFDMNDLAGNDPYIFPDAEEK